MFRLIFCALLTIIPTASAQIVIQEPFKDHLPLAAAVIHITNHYIDKLTNTLIIMKICESIDQTQLRFQYCLLNYIVQNVNKSLSIILHQNEVRDDKSWKYTLFIVDSAESFEKQLSLIQLRSHQMDLHFLVVLTHTKHLSDGELQFEMAEMAKAALNYNIINVVIMVEESSGDVLLYRSYVMGRSCGFSVRMHLINRFHDGKLLRNTVFPTRMQNFDNCTLTIAAHEMPPLFIFKGDKKNETHLSDSNRLEGIEGYLLRYLHRALNFRIKLIFPEEKGLVFDNGTATGCFESLIRSEADVAIGSFGAIPPHFNYFTSTISYYQSPTIFAIRSGIQCSPFRQLFRPFHKKLWLLIALTLLLGKVMIRIFKLLANNRSFATFLGNGNVAATFNIFVIILGNPLIRLPRRNFTRFFIISWILFTLVLRSAYQGKMFDSLRILRRIPLPCTVNDLIRRGYIMISREYQDYYPHNLTLIVYNDFDKRYEILENADDTKRLTAISLTAYLAHYNRFRKNSRLTMVDDPIYSYQLVIYFKKHSRFKFPFDIKLKQFMSSGIINYWADQYIKRKYLLMNDQPLNIPQISNEMLFGLYEIYGGLVGVALLVFICELISTRNRILRRFIVSLQYLN